MNRRNFLRNTALTSAGLFFAERILADPYRPLNISMNPFKTISVNGRVTSDGKGIPNVVVSDGLTCAKTDSYGNYDLLTSSLQDFIFVSLPSGYRIPKSKFGTAEFFKQINHNKNENDISFNLEYYGNDSNHSFLLLADPQTQTMEDINLLNTTTIPDIQKLMSGKNPDSVFGISCGDIMFDDLKLYPEYEKAVKTTGLPFYQVFGNHDAEVLSKTDEQSVRTFKKHFGPTYYSFNKGEIHYVVLDNIFWFGGGYLGYISQEQLDWLVNDLSFVEKGKTVAVFMHIPIYTKIHERYKQKNPNNAEVVTNRQLLYQILEPYKSYVICGHMHESEFLNDGGCDIHICGAVCGGWWTGPICHDGTPNGYMVYEVNGSGLSWKYKSTELPIEHQMRIYKDYSYEEKKGLLLANIWGYNDKWKLNYYEDGVKKENFKRINSFDPLSVELHSGNDKPKKHSWVDPGYNDHLFLIEPEKNSKEIVIEAIDSFGNMYLEKVGNGL